MHGGTTQIYWAGTESDLIGTEIALRFRNPMSRAKESLRASKAGAAADVTSEISLAASEATWRAGVTSERSLVAKFRSGRNSAHERNFAPSEVPLRAQQLTMSKVPSVI